ncbi:uncharacterized protein LOC134204943 [Armigeres subalbatus]|uniref:uncharacterized protein LOC134204943 n=1 Tax=Armigeres subalbatus TaxID=124917 RepID=UPI002ED47185
MTPITIGNYRSSTNDDATIINAAAVVAWTATGRNFHSSEAAVPTVAPPSLTAAYRCGMPLSLGSLPNAMIHSLFDNRLQCWLKAPAVLSENDRTKMTRAYEARVFIRKFREAAEWSGQQGDQQLQTRVDKRVSSCCLEHRNGAIVGAAEREVACVVRQQRRCAGCGSQERMQRVNNNFLKPCGFGITPGASIARRGVSAAVCVSAYCRGPSKEPIGGSGRVERDCRWSGGWWSCQWWWTRSLVPIIEFWWLCVVLSAIQRRIAGGFEVDNSQRYIPLSRRLVTKGKSSLFLLGDCATGAVGVCERFEYPTLVRNEPDYNHEKSEVKSVIMDKIKQLIHQRGQVRGRVTKIVKKLGEAADRPEDTSFSQLKALEKKLELNYSEYTAKHDLVIAMCNGENLEEQDEKMEEFDELHTDALMKLNLLMDFFRGNQTASNVGAPQVIVTQQPLKTPIPTFDGKYEGWPKFKALFNDLVGKCGDSDATKLQYLDKALIGDASGILDARIINNNNYQQAWKLLEERFENPRVIIDTHISGLLSMKAIPKQSYKELRSLIDTCSRHVEGLRFMKQEVDGTAGLIVVKLLAMCLDGETRKQWEQTLDHGELPDLDDTLKFLRNYCQVLERCEVDMTPAKVAVRPFTTGRTSASPRTSHPATSSSSDNICEICEGQHSNYKCPTFLSFGIDQRVAKVKQVGLCFNCLRKGHQIRTCPSDRVSQVEPEPQGDRGESDSAEAKTVSTVLPEDPVSTACSSVQRRAKQVLLMTAMVNVVSKSGRFFKLRALLDSGSQVNLISESALSSDYSGFESSVDCLVTTRVTGKIPSVAVNISEWKFPPGIVLADPSFNESKDVDLLIGAELFFLILKQAQLKISEDLPTLYETQFGWVMTGAVEESDGEVVNVLCATDEDPLLKSIQRFFEQEELPEEKFPTSEEQAIEEHFRATYHRNEEGRFVVQLPFRESLKQLGDSRSLAMRRFLSSERRLAKDPEMKSMYQSFLKEYEDLGHCHEIREEDDPPGQQRYYFPHHAVIKPSSTSTKLRVVFDGKAKSNGLSLNEVLMIGPKIQSDLFSIVLRFRRHVYAFSADVEKMYRQVKIDPNQTRFQRVFWRDNPTDPIRVLELSTVTYGTAPASFLAVRSMIQLARDESNNFPEAAEAILEDCYMDDILSGASTVATAKRNRIPEQDREKLVRIEDSGTNETIRALGILWNPRSDEFLFWKSPDERQLDGEITKRNVLSQIAKLFDPLGLISPVIVVAKIIMQQLWADGLGWDETLDGELLKRWVAFRQTLVELNEIKIPRCVIVPEALHIEIHGFSDASCAAYGSCIYLRCVQKDGAVSVRLLCSKSRIAPLRRLTMPRLELCAAVTLARLVSTVISILKIEIHDVKLWSDSQIVLAWLKKSPDQLHVYVKNRVVEINKLTEGYKWKYVRSEDNPADLVSRGCNPETLCRTDLWWNGPLFLQATSYEDQEVPMVHDDELPEIRIVKVCNQVTNDEDEPVFQRCGTFPKLQRILAQVVRFTRLIRTTKEKRASSHYISVYDMRKAMEYIVRILQKNELSEEIRCVQSKVLPKRLANLQPFIDEKGLLRVGGRLQNSKLPFDAKHQILLPSNHRVTEMLIRNYHEERLHEGPSGLLAAIRQRYWLVNARSAIRKVTRSCVKCFKSNPKGVQPVMGNLPDERVNSASAFELTGVDYAGPVTVKEGRHKPKHIKAYIALFVCMVTKSIHLELVSDLTTEAFLAALDRFTNRRGMVRKIMSDNATNFVGASKELHQLFLMFRDRSSTARIHDFLIKKEIEWEFIPPRSPNFGGLWEAGVKVIKSHLHRTLGNAILTFEEFGTVLTHIEAIVNSRPLYALSDDPNEPLPITPAHLMLGRPLEPIQKPSYSDIPVNRLSRYQYLNFLREGFWARWSRDYLSTLQSRVKWTKSEPNLKMGTIVLLVEDNQPVQTWKMGRIVALYPGRDHVIRVADVKTAAGVFRRSIRKLAPLPIADNVESAISVLE